jgi:hypothetical protein
MKAETFTYLTFSVAQIDLPTENRRIPVPFNLLMLGYNILFNSIIDDKRVTANVYMAGI